MSKKHNDIFNLGRATWKMSSSALAAAVQVRASFLHTMGTKKVVS